ncbi:MAG: 5-formyltetrahydrofolate cyclo-ligase [Coriobacteriia bacterium]|nr:5-formyltetrahydrofolate cyclo-ligase [Coriobacteriia bacterium]
MNNIAASKQQLRSAAIDIRQVIRSDADFVLKSASAIGTQILNIPQVEKILAPNNDTQVPIFATYAPSQGEANPNGFLDILEKGGRVRPHLAFPRVAGKGRLMMHFAVLEDLLPGSFNIPEPGADLPIAKLEDIAVMLVPGVAFDRTGNRLGYGKGFYDRFLTSQSTSSRRPLLVGISFDETLFDMIPADDHDIKVDYIVTPTQTIHHHP